VAGQHRQAGVRPCGCGAGDRVRGRQGPPRGVRHSLLGRRGRTNSRACPVRGGSSPSRAETLTDDGFQREEQRRPRRTSGQAIAWTGAGQADLLDTLQMRSECRPDPAGPGADDHGARVRSRDRCDGVVKPGLTDQRPSRRPLDSSHTGRWLAPDLRVGSGPSSDSPVAASLLTPRRPLRSLHHRQPSKAHKGESCDNSASCWGCSRIRDRSRPVLPTPLPHHGLDHGSVLRPRPETMQWRSPS